MVSHNLFLRNAFWLFQVALLILFGNSFYKYLVHNLPKERGKDKQPTVFCIFFLTLLEDECDICLSTVVMNFPPSPLIFYRVEKLPQFGGLRFTWTDYSSGRSAVHNCSMANKRLLPKDWPLSRLSCFHLTCFAAVDANAFCFRYRGAATFHNFSCKAYKKKIKEL